MRSPLSLILVFIFVLGTFGHSEWTVRTPDQSTERPFYIALRQNDNGVIELENYILDHASNPDSPYYGQYLTKRQIDNFVATPRNEVKKVIDWLTSNGVYHCQVTADAIRCVSEVYQIKKLFRVEMHEYTHNPTGHKVWRSSEDYFVPEHLRDIVVFVDGVSNKPQLPNRVRYSTTTSPLADSGSVTREVLMRVYNLSDTSVGSGVSVGAMEYQGNDGFSNKDLVLSEVANGVSKNPIAKDHIIGTNSYPDTESQLDVQVMYWAADDATLWYEAFAGWMYGWAVDFQNRKDVPEVVSLSWGWNEVDQCQIGSCTNETSKIYVERCNREFMKITAMGTTILCASGDAGSPGRTNEVCGSQDTKWGWNHINAIFPGGSPWVLSVGATYVVRNDDHVNFHTPICTGTKGVTCATGTDEAGTSQPVTGWTSGAGFTRWTPTPKWQQKALSHYLNSGASFPDAKYYNSKGRAYPDVSAFGHNCIIHTGFGWENVDGTSCASPIFAGVITHLNAHQKASGKPVLGFANPLLYKMYDDMHETFHDVTVGNSSCTEYMCCNSQFGFSAAKGYDVIGGLGTPNVGMMMHWLDANI